MYTCRNAGLYKVISYSDLGFPSNCWTLVFTGEMRSLCPSTVRTRGPIFTGKWRSSSSPIAKKVGKCWPRRFLFPVSMTLSSRPEDMDTTLTRSPLPTTASSPRVGSFKKAESITQLMHNLEEQIEKGIYAFRFFTLLGVAGLLVGSVLCFLKGCTHVVNFFMEFVLSSGKVISMLIEAIDVYLIGTVMLVFGMGLYELFISNLDIAKTSLNRSNFPGLFMMQERPKWLEIQSLSELKTKLGHVIVMLLLVGLFEKSKKVEMSTSKDLLCFAASILFSSCGLYLLSKLQNLNGSKHS